jgi:hypothetical protein
MTTTTAPYGPYPIPQNNNMNATAAGPSNTPVPISAPNNVPVSTFNPVNAPVYRPATQVDGPMENVQESQVNSTVKRTRSEARRLPVKVTRSKIWDKMLDSDTGLTFAEWVAIDTDVQKDLVDGIRFLREDKRKRNATARKNKAHNVTPVVTQTTTQTANAVNAVNHNNYNNSDAEDDEGSEIFDSVYFSDSSNVTADSIGDSSDSESLENESVYEYAYDLTKMKSCSPLKGMISINGTPVEAVVDSGASVSVIGKHLADELGLVPSDDEIPLVGFNDENVKTPSKVIMSVPIMIAGRLLRPEHMCVKTTGNDSLCLLGVPWMQAYGISIDICKSRIIVPFSKGNVTLQCYTRHLNRTPIYNENDLLAPADTLNTAATRGTYKDEAQECYLINVGDAQMEKPEEDLMPDEEPQEDKFEFNERNIATGVPVELVPVIERNKALFSEVSGMGRMRNYPVDLEVLLNAAPVKSRPYRMSWEERDLLKKHLDELLTLGIIEPSNCSWTSPTSLFWKREGSKRLVQDYRRLNKMFCPDFYPLPLVEDLEDFHEKHMIPAVSIYEEETYQRWISSQKGVYLLQNRPELIADGDADVVNSCVLPTAFRRA